jgi:hypothetical protein
VTAEEQLDELTRAEDILLGALGFDGDACIVSLEVVGDCYRGLGRWPDGEEFEFSSDWSPDDLEQWAIGVVMSKVAA